MQPIEKEHTEEKFKKWIMAFHCLRINGFIGETERKKIFTRICKEIDKQGYQIQELGFYDYSFPKKVNL